MKNFLIFLSIFVVTFFVVADLKSWLDDLKNGSTNHKSKIEFSDFVKNPNSDKTANYQNE